MMNSYDLQRTKDQILAHIAAKGPSLPATISSEIRVQPLFVSAFLSELYREEKVLMSHLKVGTSSLYLLPGQEKMLENFIQHLNVREREVFHLLKQRKFLKDSELSPALRVAIRSINDFARQEHNGQETCWAYIFAEEPVVVKPVEQPIEIRAAPEAPVTIAMPPAVIEQPRPEVKVEKQEKPKKPRAPRAPAPQQPTNFSLSLSQAPAVPSTPFADEAKAFLEENRYAQISVLKADKKEATFKASTQGPNGIQSYLVVAKDKKKLKEDELQAALQEAHSQRLLCLVLARGEPDKKTSQFLQLWGNFLSYREF